MTEIREIVFEYPEHWLEDPDDPISVMHAECFRAFERVAARMGFGVTRRTSLGLADFAPRVAEEHVLLVSMHTIGIYPNVARLKEAYLPGHYYLDRSGFSGWAEIAFNRTLQNHAVTRYRPAAAEAYVAGLRTELVSANRSKYAQSARDLSADLLRWGDFIFLPLQVVDDVVALLSEVGQSELLHATAAAARELGKNLVVKPHPMSADDGMLARVHEVQGSHPNVYLTDGSILRIARHASAVVTINSGVGFESLILGTPVLSVGKSDFSFVSAEISTAEELSSALSNLSIDWDKVHSFIKFFMEDYTFSVADDASLERLIRKWLGEDHRKMRNLDGVDYLTHFFQRYHRRMRWPHERSTASS